jgi:hypothetical protein
MKKLFLIIIVLLFTANAFAAEAVILPDLMNQLVTATTSKDRALMETLYAKLSSDLKMLELIKKHFPKHYALYQMVGMSIKTQAAYYGYSESFREFNKIEKETAKTTQIGNVTNADANPNKVTVSNSQTVMNSPNQDRESNSDLGVGSSNQNKLSNQDIIRNRLNAR